MDVAGFSRVADTSCRGEVAAVKTKMLFIVVGLRARASTVEAAPDFLALRNIYRKNSKCLTNSKIHLLMSAELEGHNYSCKGG